MGLLLGHPCSQSLARAWPVGSVLLTVPGNQSCCFSGRLESQGGMPCPGSPRLPRSRGQADRAQVRVPLAPCFRQAPREGTGLSAGQGQGKEEMGVLPTSWILLSYVMFEKSLAVPKKGWGSRGSPCSDPMGGGGSQAT